jgi:hypothetical protein
MATLINGFYERHVNQLLEVLHRLNSALSAEGIPYRVIGGLAAYFYVDRVDPIAARLTRDVDVLINRSDLERISAAVRPHGFVYRHVAGVDMLVAAENPKARSAVHLIFAGERVKKDSAWPAPELNSPAETIDGAPIVAVADLLKMKLTSFRDKDRVHVRDLDGVGLITPEIEARLPEILRERLAHIRATE